MNEKPTGSSTKGNGSDLHGPLIAAETWAIFDDVVRRAAANAPARCADVPVSQLRPPLACVPDLLEQAVDVLGGSPLAARRFRETLVGFGGALFPTMIALDIFASHPAGKCAHRSEKQQHHGSQEAKEAAMPLAAALLATERLEPVLAAAVYAARDVAELATLAGSVRLGLTGINALETLFDLALRGATPLSFASAFDTAVRTMSFGGFPLPGPGGFNPGEGGVPVPGFGPGIGFGPSGGAPWFTWPPPTPDGGGRPGPPQPPDPEIPPLDPGLTEHFEECLIFSIIPRLHRLGIGFRELVTGASSSYTIDSVTPDNACPGDTITITGHNFDGVAAVRFVDDRGHTISVAPATASDSEITVPLPAAAASGPVWLYIPITTRLCLTEYTMARPGRRGSIRVGRPAVIAFAVVPNQSCVERFTDARLRWVTEPPDATVRISREMDGVAALLGEDLAARGEMRIDTGTVGSRQFHIEVQNPSASCGVATGAFSLDVKQATPRFEIAGVELTQAIQMYNLSDPAAASNNSVPLIATMDTVVRVYVRTLSALPAPLAQVTGELEVNGIRYAPVNTAGGAASPFIAAPRSPLRTQTNHSLNFLIPAADATGLGQRATVRVFTRAHYCTTPEDRWTGTISWEDRPPLPVTVRRIADPDGSVIAPGAALRLVRDAFRKIPSPRTAITVRPGVFQIHDGTTEANYCHDGGYYQLALSVAYEHNANEGYAPDPHESSWIGIYMQRGCSAGGMMAWPWTSTCIAVRDATVAAHELMHTVGLGHTVTGRESCEDLFQPVACHRLPGRPTGALLEVPFDIDNNAAVTGASDLQSYQSDPRWLSPDLWILGRNLMDTRY